MASDQDRFDTAYEAFRDLADGLYTNSVIQGCNQRGCGWCPAAKWTGEAARVGAFASNLAISATDYPIGRAEQANRSTLRGILLSNFGH